MRGQTTCRRKACLISFSEEAQYTDLTALILYLTTTVHDLGHLPGLDVGACPSEYIGLYGNALIWRLKFFELSYRVLLTDPSNEGEFGGFIVM